MDRASRVFALVLALLCTGVAVPVLINQTATWRERGARAARAAELVTSGRRSVAEGRPNVAAHLYRAALALEPDDVSLQAEVRANEVARVLAEDSSVTYEPLAGQLFLAPAMRVGEPPWEVGLAYAILLRRRGRPEHARRHLSAVLTAQPGNAQALRHLGEIQAAAGEAPSAIQSFRQSLAADPDQPAVEAALARAYLADGQLNNGIGHLEAAARRLSDATVHRDLGQAYARQSKWIDARQQLEKAFTLDRSLRGVRATLGKALLESGVIERALPLLEEAWRAEQDPEALPTLGDAYQNAGMTELAYSTFTQLVALRPDDAEPYCRLGPAAESLRQDRVALQAYRACVRLGDRLPGPPRMVRTARLRLIALEDALPADVDAPGRP